MWAHGPLPVLNEEVYIVPQYVSAPAFYELPLGSGDTNTYDFFKNHNEIGPFTSVPRNTTEIVKDLEAFFSKWRLDQNGYTVELTQTSVKPDHSVTTSTAEEKELLALHANEQIGKYLNTRHITKATRLAVAYGLLTPVSCGLVHENNVDNADAVDPNNQLADDANGQSAGENGTYGTKIDSAASDDGTTTAGTPAQSTRAPLVGATNGTIGSSNSDQFFTGVNTAGTVRVNNLANLEALVNIIANVFELGGCLIGALIVIHSLANRDFALDIMGQQLEISQGQRIAIGLGLLLLAFAFPGSVNWFVASARDVNLFS